MGHSRASTIRSFMRLQFDCFEKEGFRDASRVRANETLSRLAKCRR